MQISIVEISQAGWKTWFQFVLIAINEGPYRRHLFASSFSESSANTAGENLAIVEGYDSCKTILPGRWGAPASIRCASRASARGRTDPTRAEIVPFSNSVFRISRREVVTSA